MAISRIWSLDSLYKGFDNEFKNDLDAFTKAVADITEYANLNLKKASDIKEALEVYFKKLNDLNKFETLSIFCELTLAVDSENTTALKMSDILDNKQAELAESEAIFKSFIKDIKDLASLIDTSEYLKEHKFYLLEIKDECKFMLSEKEEILLSKLKTTGSMYFQKLYDQLIGSLTAEISINGNMEHLPITVIRNMAYDADVDIRKKAYEAEIKSYGKIDKSISACLNAIKGEALTVSQIRGYESILDMTLKSSRLDDSAFNCLISSIEENLDIFQKYFNKKATILGDKDGLKYYNLFAPVGKSSLSFTYDAAASFIIDKFNTFSHDLGDFAKRAFENNWIDAEPREGKVGGAFCCEIHSLKECRIMTNYSETSFESVLTLAHELGHGYHSYTLNEEYPLNTHYSMPIAETASTFCETLICFEALKTANNDDKLVILENFISGAAQVIVDIYSRYLFEDGLIKLREDGSLSVAELNLLMYNSIHKAYGKGIDKTTIHPYMWLIKPHYYDSDSNYYNFPYAYGLLFSLGLYQKYLLEGESFTSKYKSLLKATGKSSLKEIALLCDIDINDKSFWKGSFDFIERTIKDLDI